MSTKPPGESTPTSEENPPESPLRTGRRFERARPTAPPDDQPALNPELVERLTVLEQRAARRTPLMILLAVITGLIVGVLATTLLSGNQDKTSGVAAAPPEAPTRPALTTLSGARVAVERYRPVNAQVPAAPLGTVKHFRVDVYQHVTRVAPETPPLEVWSFAVNGQFLRGTGASPPMVVNQGERVVVDFHNGASAAMHVSTGHSLDFHAEEADPGRAYPTLAPGGHLRTSFVASHPGVFMYHCVSNPPLLHVGSGMLGMFIVKPRNLPPVEQELWITQQEFYPTTRGLQADYAAMLASDPGVVAFNGYGDQYTEHPIPVRRGERIRMYLLNGGPTQWTSIHLIGAMYDHTYVEGVEGHDAQTVSLAPAQGGWVEFTLSQEGVYPLVDHDFADDSKGASGALRTANATGPVLEH